MVSEPQARDGSFRLGDDVRRWVRWFKVVFCVPMLPRETNSPSVTLLLDTNRHAVRLRRLDNPTASLVHHVSILATEGQLYPAYLNHCQSENRPINGVFELISLK